MATTTEARSLWKARVTLTGEQVRKIEMSAEDIFILLDMVSDTIIVSELKEIHIYREET